MSTAIKSLKAGKVSDKDDIEPKTLKAMNNLGVCWLTHVSQVAWKTGEVLKQWQTKRKQKEMHQLQGYFFVKSSWKGLCKVPQKEMP